MNPISKCLNLKTGQSLIEIIIAMGLVAILLPAILTGLVASREGKAQEGRRLQATALLRESEEVVRNVREKGWKYVSVPGIYHPGSEYVISVCRYDGCQNEKYDEFVGQANNQGVLTGSFPSSPSVAAFELWFTRPTSTQCNGLECFSIGQIDSLSFSGLVDGINYTVSICHIDNCFSGNYSQFVGQSTGGILNATFTYGPSLVLSGGYEVWIQQPPPPGCSGLACFGFTFANINSATISQLDSNKVWNLASGPETINDFTRQIEISDVRRDTNGNIVTSGGTLDPSTKQIKSTVSWTTPVASSVESAFYISRRLGNTSWQQTTQAHFNAGTHNGTITVPTGDGAVALNPSPTSSAIHGNKFIIDTISPMTWLINIGIKNNIRFTAQNSKAIDKIRLYIHTVSGTSPTYRFGIQADSGGNPSGTYLGSATYQPTTTGWHTIDISNTNIAAGTTYHLVIQHESGTNNILNYIQIRQTSPLNALYPLTNSPDTSANTGYFWSGSWTYTNNQPVYALEFTDATFEGNPHESGDEFETFGFTAHGEDFQVSSAKTVKDISWLVRKKASQNPQGPLVVTLQNITNSSTLASGNLVAPGAVTQTYAYYTYTFPSPIQLTPGNTYRVFVSAASTTNARAYMVKRINNGTALSLNSINYDGTNSVYFGVFGPTNYWDAAGWYFTEFGNTFTSQIFNAGNVVAFNNITWNATTPATTSIQLQVSVNNGPFIGPTGPGSFFNSPGAIPIDSNTGQSIKFKATLNGTGAVTPTLLNVQINYSP